MLGIRSMKGRWVYHANQQELRDLFWGAFYHAMGDVSEEQKELIEVARLVGLFLDNGFHESSGSMTTPRFPPVRGMMACVGHSGSGRWRLRHR